MYLDSDGYVRINVDGQWRQEHRVIMERLLGRPLRDDEHIHHIDDDRTNNARENLRLVTKAEHNSIHKTGNRYWVGRCHREETKRKLSTIASKRIGSKNPNYRDVPLEQVFLLLRHGFTLRQLTPLWRIHRQSLGRKLRRAGYDQRVWVGRITQENRARLSQIARDRGYVDRLKAGRKRGAP
jgi:hypothetical protein